MLSKEDRLKNKLKRQAVLDDRIEKQKTRIQNLRKKKRELDVVDAAQDRKWRGHRLILQGVAVDAGVALGSEQHIRIMTEARDAAAEYKWHLWDGLIPSKDGGLNHGE